MNEVHEYDFGHIAMTYTALCTLAVLGNGDSRVFSRLRKDDILNALPCLQRNDGSFQCVKVGSEHDMRFLYCACAISHMLNDWRGIDVSRAFGFIRSCHSWDGAFSLVTGQEGHGGSTFCAVASLVLMGKLDELFDDEPTWREELIQWCVSRQINGMQGRPNKKEDTCYSYWIGGTLRLLGCDDLMDRAKLLDFVLSCQTDMGGFSKLRGSQYHPDLLHSFYSLCWISMSQDIPKQQESQNTNESDGLQYCADFNLKELNCALGICQNRTHVFEECFMSKSST